MNTMEKEELIKMAVRQLDALDGDPEQNHGEADEILCETLIALGAGEVAKAFNQASARIGFWYA